MPGTKCFYPLKMLFFLSFFFFFQSTPILLLAGQCLKSAQHPPGRGIMAEYAEKKYVYENSLSHMDTVCVPERGVCLQGELGKPKLVSACVPAPGCCGLLA